MAVSIVPGSDLEAVVTPQKLSYLAYIAEIEAGSDESKMVYDWLTEALCVCRCRNTRYVSDVCRVACMLRTTASADLTDDLDSIFEVPEYCFGAVAPLELDEDVDVCARSVHDGDVREELVSLMVYRFCRDRISTLFRFESVDVDPATVDLGRRVRVLLSRFSKDVTFTSHGDRWLHVFVQLITCSWATAVTRSREPAFKAAEKQYGSLLNDIVRPVIETPTSEYIPDDLADDCETKKVFSCVAGLLLELVPGGLVAVDHEVLWAPPHVPTFFWLSDYECGDCPAESYGILFNRVFYCFNGSGIFPAAACWVLFSFLSGQAQFSDAAHYVFCPERLVQSSPLTKYT